MEFSKEELETIRDALMRSGVTGPLLEAVEVEIEKMELAEFSFDDEDDGCAGGACKL